MEPLMHILASPLAFQEGQAAAPGWTSLLPLILVFGIFYFLMIAPMRKRQKAHQAMLGALKKGDKVITNGGVYGEIAALEDTFVLLKIADDVRIKVARHAISGLEGEEPAS